MAKSGGGAGRETEDSPETKKKRLSNKKSKTGELEPHRLGARDPKQTALQRGINRLRKQAGQRKNG